LRNTELYRPFLFHAHGDNGELQPWKYGSNSRNSLGLCNVTFKTDDTCPHGHQYDWRHPRFSREELGWFRDIGKSLMINLFTSYLDLGDDYQIVEDTQ
jgi:hypothetical protein